MLLIRDLGSGVPLIVALFTLICIVGLTVRWKWRYAAARKEEVRRLVFLASQESAQAELEAAIQYADAVPTVPRRCALCFNPTTTRCSRCKAVRYCSGKCQITHWRLGHKEECHPPAASNSTCTVDNFIEKLDRSEVITPLSSLDNDLRPQCDGLPAEMLSTGEGVYGCKDGSITKEDKRATPILSSSGCSSKREQCMIKHVQASVTSSKTCAAAGRAASVHVYHDNSDPIAAKTRCRYPVSDGLSFSNGFEEIPSDSSLCSSIPSGDTFDVKSPQELLKSQNITQSCSTKSEQSSFLKFSFNLSAEAAHAENLDRNRCQVNPVDTEPVSPRKLDTSQSECPQILNSERSLSMSYERNTTLMRSGHRRSISFNSSCDRNPSSELQNQQCASSLHVKDSYFHFASTGAKDPVSYKNRSGNPLRTSVQKVIQQLKASKIPKHCIPLQNGNAQQLKPSKIPKHSGSLQKGMLNAGDLKVLFPYELFAKLFCNKVDLCPCGLINCGNSCYANAVLQCLIYTQPILAYLLQGLHSRACACLIFLSTSGSSLFIYFYILFSFCYLGIALRSFLFLGMKKSWCFMCEFECLVQKMRKERSPLSPIHMMSQIKLGHGKEEDAHEFLRYAIDAMQSACLMEAGANSRSPFAEETTLMQLTFGGYLKSKVKCMKCHGISERYERMMDLTVEIDGVISSLEDALHQFTSTETLDGENKYWCVRCKSYEKAKKKLTILEAPNVLTIALKRFQTGKFGKLSKSIQFPDVLNLLPYMSGSYDRSPIYKLYAVVVHLDIMNTAFSGHYICFVKSSQGKWFKIDDSLVKPVESENVFSSHGAYMLLYARCSPRASNLMRHLMSHNDGCRPVGKEPIWSRSRQQRLNLFCNEGNHDGYTMCSQSEGLGFDPPDSRLHPVQWIPKVDSFSDNSSLFSCSTDEGSCSTDSTRDSISIDDYAECIFGDTGFFGAYSPLRSSQDVNGPCLQCHLELSPRAMPDGHAHSACVASVDYPSTGEASPGHMSSSLFPMDTRWRKLSNCSGSSDTNSDVGCTNFNVVSGLSERKCRLRKSKNLLMERC